MSSSGFWASDSIASRWGDSCSGGDEISLSALATYHEILMLMGIFLFRGCDCDCG